MSHLCCSVCGRNAALSVWSPESYENDLCVMSPVGLGRGLGFASGDRISVLGDNEITPRFVARMSSLLKTFIDEGVVDPKMIIEKLQLEEYMPQRGKPSDKDLITRLIGVNGELFCQLLQAENISKISMGGDYQLRREVEKMKKEREMELRIQQYLGIFLEYSDNDIFLDDDVGFFMEVHTIEPEAIDFMFLNNSGISEVFLNKLRRRIHPGNDEMKILFDEIIFRRRPTLSEQMLSFPFSST